MCVIGGVGVKDRCSFFAVGLVSFIRRLEKRWLYNLLFSIPNLLMVAEGLSSSSKRESFLKKIEGVQKRKELMKGIRYCSCE